MLFVKIAATNYSGISRLSLLAISLRWRNHQNLCRPSVIIQSLSEQLQVTKTCPDFLSGG